MKQNANASSSKIANHYICNGSYWELVAPTLACSNLTGKGYDGIAIEQPILICNRGTLSNPFWTNAPNWSKPVKGTYNVGATATCGSVAGLAANCGNLTVIDQPTLSCSIYSLSEFEGTAIAQPALSCSDASMPFDSVLKGTLPNWNNLKPGTYAVNAEANCGVEILSANCGTLEVKPVELSCGTVQSSGVKGIAITPPALTCNNEANATNLVWTNTPTWNNPVAGIYSDISITATCGNITKTANCNGTLEVKIPCSDFNPNVEVEHYGQMKKQICDERDDKRYVYVAIGEQTWMAENLNYDVDGSVCYDNDPANCEKYGRLYDWITAMVLPSSCNSTSCASQIQTKHQGICPGGWHIPSYEEWDVLVNYVDSPDEWGNNRRNSGTKLKATSVWDTCRDCVAGTDDYGFSALPGGLNNSPSSYIGELGNWWGSSEKSRTEADHLIMLYSSEYISVWSSSYNKVFMLFSIRCLKDE